MSRHKENHVATSSQEALSRPRKPLSRPNTSRKLPCRDQENPCRDSATAYSLQTMSQHIGPCHKTGPESSVAALKVSITTQTAQHAVAFLGFSYISSSHPKAVNSILLPLYTLYKQYELWETINTTLNRSKKNKFLLQNLSIHIQNWIFYPEYYRTKKSTMIWPSSSLLWTQMSSFT